jgi:hypothetical protein
MPESVGGIPIHPLVVHGVVVLVPLAAFGLIVIALVPRWRHRFGSLVVAAAVVATALVPVATQSGEALEDLVAETPEVERHSELGEAMLYFALPLLLLSLLLWWFGRRTERGAGVPRWLGVVVPLIAVVVALAAIVQVVLVGHSGAEAVWG